MTATEHRDNRRIAWLGRFVGTRLVFLATAIVLVSFLASGALAAIGVAIVAAAALIGETARLRSAKVVPPPTASGSRVATQLIETVIAGLPDPMVALDQEGVVLAFNAPAGALAPALRRGGPVSLALRMPEVIEAIRRA